MGAPVGADARTPWLALLVLTEDELDGDGPNGAVAARIRDFLAPEEGVLKPAIVPGGEVDRDAACLSIRIAADRFAALMPRREELRFLAHCRRSGLGDKAAQNLGTDGLVAVVTANRFPAQPPEGVPAFRNIVHLVSVEGLDDLLVERPDFAGANRVALLSLANWSFQCVQDHAVDFQGLVEGVRGDRDRPPEQLWLRLPPTGATADATPAEREVSARLSHGFVPAGLAHPDRRDRLRLVPGPADPGPARPRREVRAAADRRRGDHLPAAFRHVRPVAGRSVGGRAVGGFVGQGFCPAPPRLPALGLGYVDELRERLDAVGAAGRSEGAALGDARSAQQRLLSVLSQDLIARIGGLGEARLTGWDVPRSAGAPADRRRRSVFCWRARRSGR